MTDKELIEAQERDIRNLLNTIRIRDDQIEVMKNAAKNYGTDFKFDTPYYRLETNYITCYRLVNIVWHKWNRSMKDPALDLRFSRCYMIQLNKEQVINNQGGNQLLKTCITYDDLMSRLLRRSKIAVNKGNVQEAAHWTKIMQMIKDETNKCTAYFNEEVK